MCSNLANWLHGSSFSWLTPTWKPGAYKRNKHPTELTDPDVFRKKHKRDTGPKVLTFPVNPNKDKLCQFII